MSYSVDFKKSASKALDSIPPNDRQRILEAIVGLKSNPRPYGCKKISGREGWRIRSQSYRVFTISMTRRGKSSSKSSEIAAMCIVDKKPT